MTEPYITGTPVKISTTNLAISNLTTKEGTIENVIDIDRGDELTYYEVKFGNDYLDLSEDDFELITKEKQQ